ncbi:MAG: hypothetical protein FVQ83_15545 [Chloroflexi bacterium]|nr:hypothetical protein [Chloroflexota bacterium]
MNNFNQSLVKFFSVVGEVQAYVNIFYLLLAFPLGIFYFVFLVAGLAAGIPLTVIWIGIPILLLVLGGWWLLAAFERQMAIWLLKENIVPMALNNRGEEGVWKRLIAHLTNQVTWKSLLFLFVKFPLGIASFVVVVISGTITIGFLSAPLFYKSYEWVVNFAPGIVWRVDSYNEALIAALIGLLMWPVSLHIIGWVAKVSGRFAAFMLGYQNYTDALNSTEI